MSTIMGVKIGQRNILRLIFLKVSWTNEMRAFLMEQMAELMAESLMDTLSEEPGRWRKGNGVSCYH